MGPSCFDLNGKQMKTRTFFTNTNCDTCGTLIYNNWIQIFDKEKTPEEKPFFKENKVTTKESTFQTKKPFLKRLQKKTLHTFLHPPETNQNQSECSRQPTTWNTLDVISNSLSKLPINPEDLPQKIPVWRKICRPVCTPRPNQNTTLLQPTANMDNQMERKIEFWYPLTTPSMVL